MSGCFFAAMPFTIPHHGTGEQRRHATNDTHHERDGNHETHEMHERQRRMSRRRRDVGGSREPLRSKIRMVLPKREPHLSCTQIPAVQKLLCKTRRLSDRAVYLLTEAENGTSNTELPTSNTDLTATANGIYLARRRDAAENGDPERTRDGQQLSNSTTQQLNNGVFRVG